MSPFRSRHCDTPIYIWRHMGEASAKLSARKNPPSLFLHLPKGETEQERDTEEPERLWPVPRGPAAGEGTWLRRQARLRIVCDNSAARQAQCYIITSVGPSLTPHQSRPPARTSTDRAHAPPPRTIAELAPCQSLSPAWNRHTPSLKGGGGGGSKRGAETDPPGLGFRALILRRLRAYPHAHVPPPSAIQKKAKNPANHPPKGQWCPYGPRAASCLAGHWAGCGVVEGLVGSWGWGDVVVEEVWGRGMGFLFDG